MRRFFPQSLLKGQWKSLSDYRKGTPKPAWGTRAIVYGGPALVFCGMLFTGGGLASPDALLSAMSLLAGGLIAAFALLASWRDRLTDRADSFSTSERLERDHLDETAAHLLVAAYGSAISAVLLVIGMNFSQGQGGELTGPIAALAAAAATFVVLVFLIALPRLYSSYVQLNGVRKELSGLHSGTRHKP